MGVHMDEGEIASLEPQLQKIFKKQLGFFDDQVLSSTLKLINKVILPFDELIKTFLSVPIAEPYYFVVVMAPKRENYDFHLAYRFTVLYPCIVEIHTCFAVPDKAVLRNSGYNTGTDTVPVHLYTTARGLKSTLLLNLFISTVSFFH
jgi:hypothetical protein